MILTDLNPRKKASICNVMTQIIDYLSANVTISLLLMTLKTSKYAWYAMRVREKIKFMNAVNAMNNMKKEKKKKNKKLTISLSCGKHPTWKSRN